MAATSRSQLRKRQTSRRVRLHFGGYFNVKHALYLLTTGMCPSTRHRLNSSLLSPLSSSGRRSSFPEILTSLKVNAVIESEPEIKSIAILVEPDYVFCYQKGVDQPQFNVSGASYREPERKGQASNGMSQAQCRLTCLSTRTLGRHAPA